MMKKITTFVILILLLSLLAACVEALPPTPTPTPTPTLEELFDDFVEQAKDESAKLKKEALETLETWLAQVWETLKFWETSKTPCEPTTEPPKLTIGKRAVIKITEDPKILRCRKSPGTKGKDDSDITARLESGTKVTVIDGPCRKDGFDWWRVDPPSQELCWAASDWLYRDLRVVLDPGHGWHGDPGASTHDMKEKDVALDIAVLTKDILENQYRVLVAMTRTGDDWEHGKEHPAKVVNEQNPNIAVSIHTNAGNGTGTEACYTVGKDTDAESKKLARLLTNSISTKLSLTNRGVFPENAKERCARGKWPHLYIHDMNPPAVIIEVAFIDNANDAELLRTRKQDFAQAIADAIMDYLQIE